MAKQPMVMCSFRIPKKLRDAVEAMAEEREENISDVFRAALEKYAADVSGAQPGTPT